MKALKTLKYFLAISVIFVATACHPEEINPKQTTGDNQGDNPVIID